MAEKLLTTKEVARYFKVSKVYIVELFRRNNIPFIEDRSKNYKIPQYFFRKEDVQVLLRKLEQFTEKNFPEENGKES